ncbi:serrate RNA effector molecule [Olea europaea subsp. europaea]|uniref:Serrate RNA effector molecule n=1 Tax=Olea europaea subsp. europaea TaxID=158383 RepID=A0A8S0S4Z7_OLEEU|nr:serrate RNA effector molecule [Olea europaea subsp. europaea]
MTEIMTGLPAGSTTTAIGHPLLRRHAKGTITSGGDRARVHLHRLIGTDEVVDTLHLQDGRLHFHHISVRGEMMHMMGGGAVLVEVMDLEIEGLDMIILVGMIERWVVDLVILMNGLMVSTWVGHLETTEVVHLIGILVMTVLLMLPTPRAPKVNSFCREGMMSYKQFIQELEDDILPSEAERRYQEYKSEYISTQKRSYFSAHKDEEWLKDKYHPTNLLAVIERRNELAQKLAKDFQLDLQSRTLDLGPAVNPSSNKSEQSSEPNSEDETDMGSKRRRHGRGSAEESAAPKAHPVSSEPRRIQIDVEQAQALVRKLDSEKGIEDNKLCRVDNDRSSRDKSHSGSSRPVIIIRGSTAVKGLEGVELLETLLTYLWRIHGVDYYGMVERNEAKGLRHVRVDAKNFDTGGNGSEWEKKLDSHWQERLKSLDPLEVMTAKEKIDAAATEALDPYVRKIRDEKYGWKYGCGAKGCTKLFHASEFVHKHLKLKHTDLVMELTSKVREELYFQNYINDENAPGGTPIMQPTILKEKPQRCMPGPGNRITDERGSRRERNNRANGSEQFDMLENPLSRDFPSNNDGALGNNPDEPMFDTFGGQGIPIAPFPSDIPPPVLMPVPGAGPLGPFVPAPPEVAMRMFQDQGGPSPYDVGRNGRSGPQVSGPAPIIALPPFRHDPRHLRSYNDLDAPEDEVTVIDYRSL